MTHITYDENGYIILSGIELPGLPETISVGSYELHRKNEFHMTLVGAKALTYLQDAGTAKELMKSAVNEFSESHDLDQFELTDEIGYLNARIV